MFYFERFRLNVKISVYSIFIWILNNERSKKLVCSNHCASLSLASIHLQIEAWSSAFFHSLRPFLQKHSIIINTAENTPSQEKQSQWSLKVKKNCRIAQSKQTFDLTGKVENNEKLVKMLKMNKLLFGQRMEIGEIEINEKTRQNTENK